MPTYPLFPEAHVNVTYYPQVAEEVRHTVKQQLVACDPQYDYAFLSTTHLVSTEQLHCAIFRALQSQRDGTMKAKALNTEIVVSLSPTSSIRDALTKFGLDPKREDLIVVWVGEDKDLDGLLEAKKADLTDEVLQSRVDKPSFEKVYKTKIESWDQATQAAVAAIMLRGV